jgi:putative Ca2+/H+ antiporter (TMEM165/GDT1 family)
MDLAVVALTFGAIFVVELPDKTFLATLVLATKYRPILVWLGVGSAFAVQTLVAVALGHAASFLPETAVRGAAALLFLAGAVILFREGRSHHQASGEEFIEGAKDVHGFRAVLASFLVLFAAEWGDLSQLLTISLVAKYSDPVGVISLHVLHYVGAAVCLTLAVVTLVELLR